MVSSLSMKTSSSRGPYDARLELIYQQIFDKEIYFGYTYYVVME